jgi:hypothetical protein
LSAWVFIRGDSLHSRAIIESRFGFRYAGRCGGIETRFVFRYWEKWFSLRQD